MNLLVFNCGSSSLNYKLYSMDEYNSLSLERWGKAHRVGVKGDQAAHVEHHTKDSDVVRPMPLANHRQAASLLLEFLSGHNVHIDIVGHRFVHGGDIFQTTTLLTPDALLRLRELMPLAPIHNPNSMSVILLCHEILPGLLQYATFDTAFHVGLPEWVKTYPLPASWTHDHGFRKYGFHGLSYQYVTRLAGEHLGRDLNELKIIACHLGTGGSSVAAIQAGRTLDCSMGWSPLAGLVMSTRCGDIDPTLPAFLMRHHRQTDQELDTLFNHRSGLLGVSGFSSDIRDCIKRMKEVPESSLSVRAKLAFDLYVNRLRQTIGGYAALLGGVDALIFTDDIGFNSPEVRQAACDGLEWAGILIDPLANQAGTVGDITAIHSPASKTAILAIKTDEELIIADEGRRLLHEVHHANS